MKKSNVLSYKGYSAPVEFDVDSGMLYGVVLGMRDGLYFEGADAEAVRLAFEGAVDDYLSFCAEHDIEPDHPFKGSFNVRIGSELHRRAAIEAANQKRSLNSFVADAIEAAL